MTGTKLKQKRKARTMTNIRNINGRDFFFECRNSGVPEIWVHDVRNGKKSGDALMYFRGRALAEGTDEKNDMFLAELVSNRLVSE